MTLKQLEHDFRYPMAPSKLTGINPSKKRLEYIIISNGLLVQLKGSLIFLILKMLV